MFSQNIVMNLNTLISVLHLNYTFGETLLKSEMKKIYLYYQH